MESPIPARTPGSTVTGWTRRHAGLALIAFATLALVATGGLEGRPASADVHEKLDPLLRRVAVGPARLDAEARAPAGALVPRGGGASARRLAAAGLLAVTSAPDEPDESDARVRVLIDATDSTPDLEAAGVHVNARVGDIVAAEVPASSLSGVALRESVRRVEAASERFQNNDLANAASNVLQARTQLGLDGTGTVLGFIDSGLDLCHQDFRTAGGKTRVRALLDASSGPPGVAYSQAQIDGLLASCGPSVAPTDTLGHGTHVAGIAAGDGSAAGGGSAPAGTYAGVAPNADIVIVKTDFRDDTFVAGLDFINSQAAALGRPWVANFSAGSHFGAHDGTSLAEQAIDSLVGPGRPGKAVVVAAGNEGNSNVHASAQVAQVALGGTSQDFTVNVPAGTTLAAFDFWYKGSDSFRVGFVSPDGQSLAAASPLFGNLLPGNPTYPCWQTGIAHYNCFELVHTLPQAANGDHEVHVVLAAYDSLAATASLIPGGAPAGTWTFEFEGQAVTNGRLDGWAYACQSPSGSCSAPFTNHIDPSMRVSVPGTARNVITVGAYSTRDLGTQVGALAGFSSDGPTRDGRQKPDIAAPGTAIISSLTSAGNPTGDVPQPGGFHTAMQGTSMASPHVAGAIALLFEAAPGLDAQAAKTALTSTTKPADGFTGSLPNARWGAGKVDVLKALCSGLPTPPAGCGQAPSISGTPPSPAVVGTAYSFAFTTTGTPAPTVTLNSGTLPPGLTVSTAGLLSGTPTSAGSYSFTLRAANGASSDAITPTRTIVVNAAVASTPPSISGSPSTPATTGASYSYAFSLGGVPAPTTTLNSGTLPPGIGLSTSGVLSGIPTTVGTYSFSVRASNGVGADAVTGSLTIVVAAPTGNGSIVVLLDVEPDAPGAFVFVGDGPSSFTFEGGFSLDDDPASTTLLSSRSFVGLGAGTYHLTELAPSGFALTLIACADPTSDSTIDSQTATITLAAGETVTCTFTNGVVTAGGGGGGGGVAIIPTPTPSPTPTPPVAAGPPPLAFFGVAPGRGLVALLVVGTDEDLGVLADALASSGCDVGTLAVIPSGRWLVYIPGAPAAVNAAFPPRLSALTPFFVRCAG
ncbi:MAG: S8 family serine peptidase [Dehalococcoidia bacterium]